MPLVSRTEFQGIDNHRQDWNNFALWNFHSNISYTASWCSHKALLQWSNGMLAPLFVYVCLHIAITTYLGAKKWFSYTWRLLHVHEDQESSKQMIKPYTQTHKHTYTTHPHTGKGDPCSGVQCTGGQVPSDSVWWCPWAISWSHGAVPHRRKEPRYKLSLHGGLCGPRILFCWNCIPTCNT